MRRPPTRLEIVRLLRNAPPDSWIALSENDVCLIAVGKTYAEVAAASERAGVPDAVILKTPAQQIQ
jgi:hypothetical protein